MKKSTFIIASVLFILVIMGVVQIVVSNNLATKGVVLAKIDASIASYKKENALLNEKVLFDASLSHIASEAAGLGFIPDSSHVAISQPIPVAIKE